MKVIDIENLNEPWDKYNIQGTPTIIHFKDGKEVSRISGEQSKEKFKEWFEQTKNNEKLLLHEMDVKFKLMYKEGVLCQK